MDDFDDGQFNFWLTMYVNDVRLVNAMFEAPQCYPHVDPNELKWEIETAWRHLEELIPQSHLNAIAKL